VPASVTKRIASALNTSHAYVQVASILLEPAVQALAKPEAYGTAELLLRGKSNQIKLRRQDRDTFTPEWSDAAGWKNVKLERDIQVLVRLKDKDLHFDDPIGSASLVHADLERAFRSGKVEQVKVGQQGTGQILFVGVLVSPAE
jgi:hypothetical protein